MEPTFRNTELSYQYRDGSNYRTGRTVVLAGTLTEQQTAGIRAALDSGTWFLPAQVGLPTLQEAWPSHYEDDHVWHELVDIVGTDAAPTEQQTASEFAAAFVGVSWDVVAAEESLEQWKASTPRGR